MSRLGVFQSILVIVFGEHLGRHGAPPSPATVAALNFQQPSQVSLGLVTWKVLKSTSLPQARSVSPGTGRSESLLAQLGPGAAA